MFTERENAVVLDIARLTESTLDMVTANGFAEYFNPLTGEPLGTRDFSWTAALVIDLLHTKK